MAENKQRYYLGVDQGTTGTTVLLFDENWRIRSCARRAHKQIYPRPGWVEHDPVELWECVADCVRRAIAEGGITPSQVRCLGLANQGETVMAWNRRTGEPFGNAIVWQDRRTARQTDALRADCGGMITEKTGLVPDAYFSALKIRWILDNVAGAARAAESGDLIAGNLDAWLIWKMTGGRTHATDYSTASRTMLLNIHTGRWDEEIAGKAGVPVRILPEIRDTCGDFGATDAALFGASIPISAGAVDQQAALFGQGCHREGSLKTTYGTGCFMLMNTGGKPVRSSGGLLTTVAWGLKGKMTFALDGGVYMAGGTIQWLRDGLGIISDMAETEALAKSVPDSGGVVLVPAFAGLAAPYWDQYARGTLTGLSCGTARAHIVRAALESIAFRVNDNFEVMKRDSGMRISAMRADGGMVVNDFLMQFQADILGVPVDIPEINETTALGAAEMAALGVGDFGDVGEMAGCWKLRKRYEPAMPPSRRDALLAQWKKAVERARNWADE